VAEPWSRDFDALAERSRHGLRPLDAFSHHRQETKMRFFKAHPALAALFTVLAIGLVSGAAYAVVKEVWVTVDPSKPPEDLAKDVQSQLQQQGVAADVETSQTPNGHTKISIVSHDPAAGSNMHINVAAPQNDEHRRVVRMTTAACVGHVDPNTVADIMSASDVVSALEDKTLSDDQLIAKLRQALADHGYHDVTITLDGETIDIHINAPPTK
jgi:hypothetical protein